MGLFDIKDFLNGAVEVAKDFGNGVIEFTKDIYNGGKRILNSLTSSQTSSPDIDIYTPHYGGDDTSIEEEIERHRQHNKLIAKYQRIVSKNAIQEEKAISDIYDEVHKSIVSKLKEQSIDTASIEKYIKEQKKRFSHVMRNEVNERVNPCCEEWEELMDDEYSTKSDIKEYTDSVYRDAQHLLYDTLSTVTKDTALFIEKYVKKYLSDRRNALKSMKQSLVNMTSDEETRDKEIQKLSEEYATMLFITNSIETKLKQDD